jgi:hypothetical protein
LLETTVYLCEKREMTVKRLTNRVLVVFGLCLLMAASASADVWLYLSRTDYHYTDGRYVVGPLGASFAPTGGTQFDVFCDDWVGRTYLGASFKVNVANLTDVESSTARFKTQGLDEYKRAAWLITQMAGTSTGSEVAAIQHALWYLFSGAPQIATEDRSLYWYNQAIGIDTPAEFTATNINFSSFEILTPVNASPTDQEFIRRRVPEPAMLGTLLFGFLGTGLFWRRRQRAV